MAISDKLTYLNDTKTQLKDMINYGLDTGEKITNETTFRNYVRSLFGAFIKTMTYPDVLYDNLPKVTGTGTSVTLNGTVEAPMRNILSPSELSQEGEPSPSNPQDIHTVSGENEIKFEGKNLFDKSTEVDNYYIDASGNITANNGFAYSALMPVEQTNYILKGKTYETSTKRIHGYNSNGVWVKQITYEQITANNDYSIPITINDSNIKYIRISIKIADTDVKVIKNSEIATYPISLGDLEYCKIGDYEDSFVRTSGKNKFNKADFKQIGRATYTYSNGIYTITPNGTGNVSLQLNIDLPPGTYTYQGYSNGTTQIRNSSATVLVNSINTQNTFTISEDGARVVFNWATGTSTNVFTVDMNDIQIEEGSTATELEPFGTGEWYLKKNVGKVLLKGDEAGWHIYQSTGIIQIYIDNATVLHNAEISLIKSNYFISSIIGQRLTVKNSVYTFNGGIAFNPTEITTIADFKNWLSTHNTTVYYCLATPTFTLLSDTLQTQLDNLSKAISYQDQTNVSQENTDLPFVLSLSAIKDYEEI